MHSGIDSASVTRDITVLYELALAVGQSLDLEQNCAQFLKALIARKSLAYAAVWIRDDLIADGGRVDQVSLCFASPSYRVRERQLAISHPMFTALGSEPSLSVDVSDTRFAELVTEKDVASGVSTIFALGDIGVLKLLSLSRKTPFSIVEQRQLINVINKFTVSLRACLSNQRLLTMQQRLIEAQDAALRELSTPLIPLADQVLVMPLIGTIDDQRAQRIMETLLDGIGQYQAEAAIIDITGVRSIDTQSANSLMRVARAAQLLGAQVILTGISAEIAQTIVQLGIKLELLVTCRNLQEGIEYAQRSAALPYARLSPRPLDM